MPTYDYRCKACNHEFELFQSMSDSVKKKCPSCGKSSLERLIGTGAAVVFKGSGFYQTDYRSEGYKKAAEAEKPATKDAKPAASESAAPAKASTDTASKPAVASAAPAEKPGKKKESARKPE